MDHRFLELSGLAIDLKVHKVLYEVLDAEGGTLLLQFIGTCCEQAKERVKDKVGCCLITEHWGIAVWEAAFKNLLK